MTAGRVLASFRAQSATEGGLYEGAQGVNRRMVDRSRCRAAARRAWLMVARPGGRGPRRYRECAAKGCGRPYYGPAPFCHECRILPGAFRIAPVVGIGLGAIADPVTGRFRPAIAQTIGTVFVIAAIVLCP